MKKLTYKLLAAIIGVIAITILVLMTSCTCDVPQNEDEISLTIIHEPTYYSESTKDYMGLYVVISKDTLMMVDYNGRSIILESRLTLDKEAVKEGYFPLLDRDKKRLN